MITRCPGAQSFREPQAVDRICPSCGYVVEMWTDEVRTVCPRCNTDVAGAPRQSCLDWCAFARECAGEAIYANYLLNKEMSAEGKKML